MDNFKMHLIQFHLYENPIGVILQVFMEWIGPESATCRVITEAPKLKPWEKFPPAYAYITVAQESTTGLWHGVLMRKTGRIERFIEGCPIWALTAQTEEGYALRESAMLEAAKQWPNFPVMVQRQNGFTDYEYWGWTTSHDRQMRMLREADERREEKKRRLSNGTNNSKRSKV